MCLRATIALVPRISHRLRRIWSSIVWMSRWIFFVNCSLDYTTVFVSTKARRHTHSLDSGLVDYQDGQNVRETVSLIML
jgi:hypothetical protein